MCLLNPFCPVSDGPCSCSLLFSSSTTGLNFQTLCSALTSKQSLLKNLSLTVNELEKRVDLMMKESQAKSHSLQYEIATPSVILKIINPSSSFKFRLQPDCDALKIVYKERNFSLKFRITDEMGKPAFLQTPAIFKLGLFTVDNPPTDLMKTNEQRKILRGNLEVLTTHEIEFRKICISQVSSHYRNGVFALAVIPDPLSSVQPFIIPDIIVKARKILAEPEKFKKMKVQNELDDIVIKSNRM